jgi:hypothetical protein
LVLQPAIAWVDEVVNTMPAPKPNAAVKRMAKAIVLRRVMKGTSCNSKYISGERASLQEGFAPARAYIDAGFGHIYHIRLPRHLQAYRAFSKWRAIQNKTANSYAIEIII